MTKENLSAAIHLLVYGLSLLSFGVMAQPEPLLPDPELLRNLSRVETTQFMVGRRFPNEELSCAYLDRAVVDFRVLRSDGAPEVLFTSVPTSFANYKLFPNIVHRLSDGTWVRTPVPHTRDGYSHVAFSQDRNNWLVAMENVPQAPGWDTRVVISEDGGSTWRYGESLTKYVYMDGIRYLEIDETGTGTAIEHYEGNVEGYEQIGYYVFETDDWGNTWTEWQYESEFDTSGLVDGYPAARRMRLSIERLSEVSLPGFDECR